MLVGLQPLIDTPMPAIGFLYACSKFPSCYTLFTSISYNLVYLVQLSIILPRPVEYVVKFLYLPNLGLLLRASFVLKSSLSNPFYGYMYEIRG